MTKHKHAQDDDARLAGFFEAARAQEPLPSSTLLARIMTDAQDALAAQTAIAPTAPRRRLWAVLAVAVGGWPALASMATAAVAGVWIGAASPDTLSTMTGGLFAASNTGFELEELSPGYAALMAIGDEVTQ